MAGAPENRGKKNEKESFRLFPHVASGTSCVTGKGKREGEGLEGYGRSRGMLLFTSLGPGA